MNSNTQTNCSSQLQRLNNNNLGKSELDVHTKGILDLESILTTHFGKTGECSGPKINTVLVRQHNLEPNYDLKNDELTENELIHIYGSDSKRTRQ